jgi:hypothetical protein
LGNYKHKLLIVKKCGLISTFLAMMYDVSMRWFKPQALRLGSTYYVLRIINNNSESKTIVRESNGADGLPLFRVIEIFKFASITTEGVLSNLVGCSLQMRVRVKSR